MTELYIWQMRYSSIRAKHAFTPLLSSAAAPAASGLVPGVGRKRLQHTTHSAHCTESQRVTTAHCTERQREPERARESHGLSAQCTLPLQLQLKFLPSSPPPNRRMIYETGTAPAADGARCCCYRCRRCRRCYHCRPRPHLPRRRHHCCRGDRVG